MKEWKDMHAGEACAILCNGPTLTDHCLSKIDCVTIGLNMSWRVHQSSYHVATDSRQFYKMRKANKWPLRLFTGTEGPKSMCPSSVTNIKILPTMSVTGFDLNTMKPTIEQCPTPLDWSWDLERGAYLSGTVTYLALQLAAYMGFKTIYLVGLDLCRRDGQPKFKGHPDNWKGAIAFSDKNAEGQNETMNYAAGSLRGKVEVYNLSQITACTAFPLKTFEEVFPLTRLANPQRTRKRRKRQS